MNCDQVFAVLTRGPFPSGDASRADEERMVELHLDQCPQCWHFAEALRPASDVFEEAIPATEARDLPGYRSDLPRHPPLASPWPMVRAAEVLMPISVRTSHVLERTGQVIERTTQAIERTREAMRHVHPPVTLPTASPELLRNFAMAAAVGAAVGAVVLYTQS